MPIPHRRSRRESLKNHPPWRSTSDRSSRLLSVRKMMQWSMLICSWVLYDLFRLWRCHPSRSVHTLLSVLELTSAFGSFYARHVEALTGSVNDADDPDKVSKACYAAAIIYAAFIAFCGLQVSFPSPSCPSILLMN